MPRANLLKWGRPVAPARTFRLDYAVVRAPVAQPSPQLPREFWCLARAQRPQRAISSSLVAYVFLMVGGVKRAGVDAVPQQLAQSHAPAGGARLSLSIGAGKQNAPSSNAQLAIRRRARSSV
jgi:hypothetical protein